MGLRCQICGLGLVYGEEGWQYQFRAVAVHRSDIESPFLTGIGYTAHYHANQYPLDPDQVIGRHNPPEHNARNTITLPRMGIWGSFSTFP